MKWSVSCVGFALLCAVNFSTLAEEVASTGGRGFAAGVQKVYTVTQINQDSREVTLRDADGQESTFIAEAEIRNLGQVDVGDTLTAIYAEALALQVYPVTGSGKGRIVNTEVSRAPLGDKPQGTITKHVEITGRVAGLDRETRMVTLEGKHGSLTLRAAADIDLSKIAVDDMVRIDYLERFSIKVETPK